MIRTIRPGRKHLALLAGLVAMLVLQPLIGHRTLMGGVFCDVVLFAICLYIFFIVFGGRREMRNALALILPAFASNFAIYLLTDGAKVVAEVLYHCFMVGFLGFAIAVILGDILRKSVIAADDVIGALCGYILVALVWASLYSLTYLLAPGTFSINKDIVWRLDEWHQRRALFDYLSFTTMMTLGYGDLTPIGPPAYTLTWLEVMFGQFYLAVVVAQLVGLKLAQALKGDRPESK
jgi:voltage-gated potassium channel